MFRLLALLVLLAASAQAQSTSLTTYVKAQLPTNTSRAITAVNVQNAVLAYPNNVYVSSSFPVTTTSYVTATTYYGDGSHLTGVAGGSSTTPGGVSGSVQFNNGTTTSLGGDSFFTYLAGLLQTTSISTSNISSTGPISASTYYGDGSHLTGISAGVSSYNSLTNIPTVLANISNSTGSVTVTSVNATTGTFTNVAGTLTTAAQPNITSLGTQVNVTTTNLTAGLVSATTTSGTYGYFSNVSASTVTAINGVFTNVAGTLSTGAQPNITSIGTQTNVTTTNLTAVLASNTTTSGTYAYARYVSATQLAGDCSLCTNIPSGGTPQSLVSSTTRVDARSDGTVSFTTGGVLTGYMDTSGRFILPGISVTTNQASFTLASVNTVSGTYGYSKYISTTQVSSTGNISANKFIGDGSLLTGIASGGMTISATQNHPSTSIYVGFNSGGLITSGNGNAALGDGALASSTTAVNNVAVGSSALNANATGQSNVAIGYTAMASNTTASSNVAVGNQALLLNKTGASNVVVGSQAMQNISSSDSNVAIGIQAAQGNGAAGQAVNQSVFVGGAAGGFISASTGNVMMGYRSGVRVTTGSSNTLIGRSAGFNENAVAGLTTGSNNIAIGALAMVPSATVDNQMSIGNAIYGLNIISGSNPLIGLGTQTPTTALEVSGTISGTSLSGVLATAAQPNITGLGTLTGLTISGVLNVGGAVSASGLVTAQNSMNVSGTLTADNVNVLGTCTNCGGGGGGTSISTTTFTAASNISGSTAIGYNAFTVGTGISNTAYGAMALASATTATNNTAIGAYAMATLNAGGGTDNVAIGTSAYRGAGGGNAQQNVVIGSLAAKGMNGSTSQRNVVIGYDSFNTVTTGASDNVAIGSSVYAGQALAAGRNVLIGVQAGAGANTSQSVVIGYQANHSNTGTTGGTGVYVGYQAGQAAQGYNNVAIGAMTVVGTGAASNNNIAIGTAASIPSNTASNQMSIANSIYGLNMGLSTVNIGIGTQIPTAAFEVSGTVKFDNIAAAAGLDYICYDNSTGLVTYSATTCTVSDRKFKTNIVPYNASMDKVMAMQVRQFDFKNPAYGKGKQVGLIAQELEPLAPQLVGHGSNGDLSVDYAKLSVYAIGAIQQLERHNEALEKQILDIQEQLNALKRHPKSKTGVPSNARLPN